MNSLLLLLFLSYLPITEHKKPTIQIVRPDDSLGKAPEITPLLEWKPIMLPEKFTNAEVLHAFFPGKLQLLEGSGSKIMRVYWRSGKHKPIEIPTIYDEEKQYFIDSNDKDTRFLAKLKCKDSLGREQLLIATYTNDAEDASGLLTGRFNCGIISLAQFTKDTSIHTYALTAYNPYWHCLGLFGSPLPPKLLEVGPGRYALNFLNYFQAGGGPVMGSYILCEPESQTFKTQLNPLLVEIWNIEGTNFHSKFQPIQSELHDGHYDLILTTKGTFAFAAGEWGEEELGGLPKKLVAFSKKHDQVKFTWKRTLRFKNHQYEQIDEKLEMKAGKFSEANK